MQVVPTLASYPPPTMNSFENISTGSSSGGQGSYIFISGAGFTGATQVSFGRTPAQSIFVETNGGGIIAVVGSGSSGSISVTTPGGAASIAGFVFVPAPAITSFAPTSAGSGNAVVITGTNFTGATAVSFGGTPALSFTVNSDTQITASVDRGSSGSVSFTTLGGTATSITDFTFIQAPTIMCKRDDGLHFGPG